MVLPSEEVKEAVPSPVIPLKFVNVFSLLERPRILVVAVACTPPEPLPLHRAFKSAPPLDVIRPIFAAAEAPRSRPTGCAAMKGAVVIPLFVASSEGCWISSVSPSRFPLSWRSAAAACPPPCKRAVSNEAPKIAVFAGI